MAILAIIEVPADPSTDPAEEAAKWAQRNERDLPASSGFIFHVDGPSETGWRLAQVWESADDLRGYFDEYVAPYLPPNAPPLADVARIYPLEHVVAGKR